MSDPFTHVRRVGLLVAVVVAVALTAWGIVTLANDGSRVVHDEGEGPLSMHSGGGGAAGQHPGLAEWWATYGSAFPCVDGVDEATITAVRFDAKPAPLEIRANFMFVPPKSQRSPDDPGEYAPTAMVYGRYPNYGVQKYGDTVISKERTDALNIRYSTQLPINITVPCEAHPAPDTGWVEMLTEIKVDHSGTHVPRTFIDYEVDGKPYTLVHRWVLTMCGDAPNVVEVMKELRGRPDCGPPQ